MSTARSRSSPSSAPPATSWSPSSAGRPSRTPRCRRCCGWPTRSTTGTSCSPLSPPTKVRRCDCSACSERAPHWPITWWVIPISGGSSRTRPSARPDPLRGRSGQRWWRPSAPTPGGGAGRDTARGRGGGRPSGGLPATGAAARRARPHPRARHRRCRGRALRPRGGHPRRRSRGRPRKRRRGGVRHGAARGDRDGQVRGARAQLRVRRRRDLRPRAGRAQAPPTTTTAPPSPAPPRGSRPR